MRLTNLKEIEDFKAALEKCIGDVWLEDDIGNKFNLRSVMSQYVALGELLQDRGERLELFCSRREDENLFIQFFMNNPNTL
jgi:hypothetical protein